MWWWHAASDAPHPRQLFTSRHAWSVGWQVAAVMAADSIHPLFASKASPQGQRDMAHPRKAVCCDGRSGEGTPRLRCSYRAAPVISQRSYIGETKSHFLSSDLRSLARAGWGSNVDRLLAFMAQHYGAGGAAVAAAALGGAEVHSPRRWRGLWLAFFPHVNVRGGHHVWFVASMHWTLNENGSISLRHKTLDIR